MYVCMHVCMHVCMYVRMYVHIILVELINNKKKCMGIFRNEDRISKQALNAKVDGILRRGSLKCSWE
jgi:hypothetical protein